MTPITDLHELRDLSDLQRLHDEAHARALQLRREAFADFWRGANGLLVDAAHSAQRSAARLAQSLRRHRMARSEG